MSEFTLYGIKNCNSVRKSRQFLAEQAVTVRFHDYRQDGIDAFLIDSLIAGLGEKALLNTRGTTWRNLPAEMREAATQPDHLRQVMLDHPAVIKRPVLVRGDGKMLVGFDPANWLSFLQEKS